MVKKGLYGAVLASIALGLAGIVLTDRQTTTQQSETTARSTGKSSAQDGKSLPATNSDLSDDIDQKSSQSETSTAVSPAIDVATSTHGVADVLEYLRNSAKSRTIYVPKLEDKFPELLPAHSTTDFKPAVSAYLQRTAVSPGDNLALKFAALPKAASAPVTSVAMIDAQTLTIERRITLPTVVEAQPQSCASHSGKGCDFAGSLEISTSGLKAGLYFLLLEREKHPVSEEVFFILRSKDAAQGRVAVLAPEFTWQAYNSNGGHSFYTDQRDDMHLQVSFNRPVSSAVNNDYHNARALLPFVRVLREMGIEPWLVTSIDLHEDTKLLDGVSLLVITGHDEYWSDAMRNAFESFLRRGGRAAIFSGNTMWWKVNIADDAMYLNQNPDSDSSRPLFRGTGYWFRPWINRPTVPLIGLSYYVGGVPVWSAYSKEAAVKAGLAPEEFLQSAKMRVAKPGHPIFEGTGLTFGDWFGGDSPIMFVEVDSVLLRGDGSVDNTSATKFPRLDVLATAFVHDPSSGAGDGFWAKRIVHSGLIAELSPEIGGRLIHFGSIGWFNALDSRDPQVTRIFRNAISYLRRP